MIESQWSEFSLQVSGNGARFRLVDHGCGQGLAGLLLFDRFGEALVRNIAQIVLVEPSKVALIRAEAIYRCIAPQSPIVCVNSDFDDLSPDDLRSDASFESVHLFSNVLDVDGFDQFALFNKALSDGRHTFLVVSHDRNGYGGSDRILKLKCEIEDPKYHWLTVIKSEVARFKCSNPSQSDAISWLLQLDVNRG